MGQMIKLVVVAMLLGALPAYADGNWGTPTPVERHLIAKGVKIVKAFPTIGGMKAVVADNGRQQRLFYVTPDGQGLISGFVFDSKGTNITTQDMARAQVRDVGSNEVVSQAELQEIWRRAERLSWIADGTPDASKTLYVFFDANCPYCHALWTQLRTPIEQKRVQVRWIPVAILRPSSKGLAASIYESKTPSLALADMVNRQLQPGYVSDVVNRKLAHNVLLLRDTGYTGVPVILSKDRDGSVHASMGLPSDQQLVALLQ